jgi:hypothetical protein
MEVPSYSLNSYVLKEAVTEAGHDLNIDLLRKDTEFLKNQFLVTIQEKEQGKLWMIKLTPRGKEVALGLVRIKGIKPPELGLDD